MSLDNLKLLTKKDKLGILLSMFLLICMTGCASENLDKSANSNDEVDMELIRCLENELGAYLVTEKDALIDINIDEIDDINSEKIDYFKGVRASNHKDNKYIIVYPKNGTYDADVMKKFDKYFYDKYTVYQMSYVQQFKIYAHTQENDIDFSEISSKCESKSTNKNGKNIPNKTLNEIDKTTKIIVRSGENEIGTIKNKTNLDKILNAISTSRQFGEAFLCDGNGFDFEMYDKENKLIDTLYVWGDGRIIPESIHEGCSYYTITDKTDLRKIIEEETDFRFYNLLDYRENSNHIEELIYKDGKNSYYIKSKNANDILIKFEINNKIMTLKNALENEYISAEKVAKDYPDILIKK